jgi:hypothetical protein
MLKPRTFATLLLGLGLFATGTRAPAQQTAALPDFTGLWHLNDQASDGPGQITVKLRAEIQREQSPTVAPASASSSSGTSQSNNYSGHGGGHGGGMGGGGGGGGGGMGGGHGHGGGGRHASASTNSSSGDDKLNPPPLIDNDSVLIVQQDPKTLQAQLENGEQLALRFDGNAQQTLNGSAVTRMQTADQGVQFSLEFNDGTRIDETWSRSADGHTLRVTEQWQPSFLQHPVTFQRDYDRVDH